MTLSESSPSNESVDLLRRIQAGDNEAVTLVFEQYMERLTRLAQSRIAARLAARVDPEDIVMSAYRSFFVAARAGRFELHRGGDLWRLLVEMTLHKLYRQVEFHQAQRRSVGREQRLSGAESATRADFGSAPMHEEAVAAADELEAILQQLPEHGRQALELRLQGYEHEEIAERLECSERTVGRLLNEARRIMVSRAGGGFVPSAARVSRVAPSTSHSNVSPAALNNVKAQRPWSDFVLQEQIGIGATGKVYRALQKSCNQQVAIKFLKKPLTRESSVVERFLRESQMVADMAHPGIVAIQGAGRTAAGGFFLVMDLVRGCDLDHVYRNTVVGTRNAVNWIVEAARIVHVANERRVIHCDLKPSNLLLDELGHIRVTDFGLAVRTADTTATWLAETPAFMAPEQVDPCWGVVSAQTDVWGLGAIPFN